MLSSTCAICGKKKSTFIKNQEIHKFSNKFKMSKLINKCLLTGEKISRFAFKSQPGFRLFTKHRGRIQKFRETDNLKHLCRNELDKACFAHDAPYYDSTDLAKRSISDDIFKDRAYEIASMVYKQVSEVRVNKQLAEELHKLVNTKIKRTKVYASFKDSIQAADLGEMTLLSSKNKNIEYSLYVIHVFL